MLQSYPAAGAGCKCGKLRPPRKLHAAVGLWLALFVCVHFAICLSGLNPLGYERVAGRLHGSLGALPGAVLVLVLLPMMFQAGCGLYLIAKEGMQYNVKRCDRGGKLRYFLQRWSGVAIAVFLLPHVAIMRAWWQPSLRISDVGSAFEQAALGFHPWNSTVANTVMILFLLAGMAGTAFHVANGAWSGAILWKLVKSEQGKSRMGRLSLALGTMLAAMGCLAWYAFSYSPGVHAALASLGR